MALDSYAPVIVFPFAILTPATDVKVNFNCCVYCFTGFPVQELIRSLSPLPKLAVPRSRKRKSEEATLLTASPYKDQLLEKEALKTAKENGRGYKGNSGKGKGKAAPKRKSVRDQSSDEDEEWPCIICAEPFANSRSKEVWIQCISCLKWAHEECTPGDSRFVCPNCESDASDF